MVKIEISVKGAGKVITTDTINEVTVNDNYVKVAAKDGKSTMIIPMHNIAYVEFKVIE